MTPGVVSCGMLSLPRVLAEMFLAGCDFEPDSSADLLAELETAMGEAALEAGYDVLREHGYGWVLDGQQQPVVTGSRSTGGAS